MSNFTYQDLCYIGTLLEDAELEANTLLANIPEEPQAEHINAVNELEQIDDLKAKITRIVREQDEMEPLDADTAGEMYVALNRLVDRLDVELDRKAEFVNDNLVRAAVKLGRLMTKLELLQVSTSDLETIQLLVVMEGEGE